MRMLRIILPLLFLMGCASQAAKVPTMLAAPANTKPEVAAQLEKGNALFMSRDLAGAEQLFKQTIATDPTLAEAHYNLAVTLDRQGNQAEAKKHYIEAANLAPGHKIIWDSPPLRTQTGGYGHDVHKKSYQDPSYKGF